MYLDSFVDLIFSYKSDSFEDFFWEIKLFRRPFLESNFFSFQIGGIRSKSSCFSGKSIVSFLKLDHLSLLPRASEKLNRSRRGGEI